MEDDVSLSTGEQLVPHPKTSVVGSAALKPSVTTVTHKSFEEMEPMLISHTEDTMNSNSRRVGLLDLSDEVLLYILRHCTPRDLMALGFSCARLACLVRERSLWRRVDARSEPCSRARLKWFVENVLHSDTQMLMLRGYAEDSEGHRCFPTWPVDGDRGRSGPHTCTGPKFTLTQELLELLKGKCPQLTVLGLEYCNIDCSDTLLGSFPCTLKKLSLRGTKCYNMTYDKSFLFKIQDYLPLIESLDVSECEWIDPATLLSLIKMRKLEELIMRVLNYTLLLN